MVVNCHKVLNLLNYPRLGKFLLSKFAHVHLCTDKEYEHQNYEFISLPRNTLRLGLYLSSTVLA
jgi:hypothetical protein